MNRQKANLKQSSKETIPESKIKREIEKFRNISMNELVKEPIEEKRILGNSGRKLGELSKNTKTEIFKQFSNFDI